MLKKGTTMIRGFIPLIKNPLRKEDLQFPQISNASPDPILITNTKGHIYYVNPAWEKQTGYTFADVKGKNLEFLHSDKTPKRVYKMLWKALSEGKPFITEEIRDKRKDGAEYQIHSTFYPIRKNKRNRYYVQVMHDITEHKAFENALYEKDEILEQIINNTSGYAIFMLDKKGFIKTWNKAAQNLKGYTTEEIIGKHFSIFYPPENGKKRKPQKVLEIAAKNGRYEEEGLRMKKDGRLFWASVVITAIRSKRGALKGFVKITRDITEKKNIENMLRFRDQVLSNMAEGVCIVRLSDNKIVYTNPAFDTMFGYERDELIGQDVSVVNDAGKEWSADAIDHIANTIKLQHRWTGEVPNRKKDDTEFLSLVTISSVNYLGIGDCWIGVHQDFTEKKELERQKDAFIGIASHELKTPLTTLSAYTQILEKKLQDDTQTEYFIKNIKLQTNRLLGLINDLLNVSKIDSGKLDLHLTEFNVNTLVTKIVQDFLYTTNSHEVVRNGSIKKKVIGDENRIEQVIINLLTNAVKYSSNAKKVVVKLTSDSKHATIAIQDFGLGIAKKDQQHIFERFYRTKDKDEGKVSGFGLGLYIANEIIKKHSGRIWVESEKGKGTTFLFTLPLVK